MKGRKLDIQVQQLNIKSKEIENKNKELYFLFQIKKII